MFVHSYNMGHDKQDSTRYSLCGFYFSVSADEERALFLMHRLFPMQPIVRDSLKPSIGGLILIKPYRAVGILILL